RWPSASAIRLQGPTASPPSCVSSSTMTGCRSWRLWPMGARCGSTWGCCATSSNCHDEHDGRLAGVNTARPSRSAQVSAVRRRAVIDALRRGAVPESGLDLLATGLDRFESALDAELDAVASGASVFKAVRGEYGSGKT